MFVNKNKFLNWTKFFHQGFSKPTSNLLDQTVNMTCQWIDLEKEKSYRHACYELPWKNNGLSVY